MKSMLFINNTGATNLIVLTFCFMLLGCGQANNSLHNKNIIYCSEGSPETFNPQLVTSGTTIDATSKQLYNRLIAFSSKDNHIIPSLATSWHITDDGRMFTFYLRKDVKFNQTDYFTPTRNFNADDVVFSFNRILDKNNPYHNVSGGKYPFFQTIKFSQLVTQVEKINDYTVRFILKHSDSSFLTDLASDFSVILSAQYANQLNKQHQKHLIDVKPIGTGPFKLKEFRRGRFIRYYKNKNYWQHPIKIDQLVYDITPTSTNRLTKLFAKECDVIGYPIAYKKIIQHTDLELNSVTSFNVGYFAFNVTKPPFNNLLVRKAISHAINFKAIVSIIYSNEVQLATSILPKNSWAYANISAPLEYSLPLAKSLLKTAGYSHGFTMDLWAMPIQRAYNPNAMKMAKLIKEDLSHVGIKVNIISFAWNTFLQRLSKGKYDTVLLGWSADTPDPDNFFTPLLSCEARFTGGNRSFWCNKNYDELLTKALATTDIVQRKKYYRKALAIIAKELPLIPIAHSKRYQGRLKIVKGKILQAFGGIDFSNTSKQLINKSNH